MASAPIADLSYRDYDGPLAPPEYRWWVIAKSTMRVSLRRRGWMWWLLMASGLYYLFMLATFFIFELIADNSPNPEQAFDVFMSRIIWKDQFLHGWSMGQMFLFFTALMLGAGAIANDVRANALLVYLSKPCDKRDYLLGKWMGLWLSLLIFIAVPTAAFYIYCGLSYSEYGFFSEDRWLLPKVVAMLAVGTAFYTSLVLGVSSLFGTGRMAGAMFAALYFLSLFFTKLMEVAYRSMGWDEGARRDLSPVKGVIERLYYASVDGLQIGMSKGILGTDGSQPFGMGGGRRDDGPMVFVPAPSLWAVLLIMGVLSAIALLIAWKRIRAVEVVR